MNPRTGMSLVEVVIATSLFVLLLVGVSEAISSTSRYARLGEEQDDLAREAKLVMRQIEDDLARSGWHAPDLASFDTVNATADRAARYWPYVQQQAPAGQAPGSGLGMGLGSQFAHTHRAAGLVALPRLPQPVAGMPNLPGQPADFATYWNATANPATAAYQASFWARSQELIFLRHHQDANGGDRASAWFPGVAEGQRVWNANWDTYPSATTSPQAAIGSLTMAEWRPAEFDYDDPLNKDAERLAKGIYQETTGANAGRWYRLRNGRKIFDLELPSAWLYLDAGSNYALGLRWEAVSDPLGSVGLGDPGRTFTTPGLYPTLDTATPYTWDDTEHADLYASANGTVQFKPELLREFMYAVVPGTINAGKLVRAVKVHKPVQNPAQFSDRNPPGIGDCIARSGDGAWGMVIDRVLSEYVVRATFDTWRTETTRTPTLADPRVGLAPNQVRVRLYLLSPHTTDRAQMAWRVVERVITMRARTSGEELTADRALLGTTSATAPFLF